jgi:hypothetical protein
LTRRGGARSGHRRFRTAADEEEGRTALRTSEGKRMSDPEFEVTDELASFIGDLHESEINSR